MLMNKERRKNWALRQKWAIAELKMKAECSGWFKKAHPEEWDNTVGGHFEEGVKE